MPDGAVGVHPKWRVLAGHAYGLRGPVVCGTVLWPRKMRTDLALLVSILHEVAGLKREVVAETLPARSMSIDTLAALVLAIERAAHAPVTQRAVATAPSDGKGADVAHALAFPSFQPAFTQAVIQWLCSVINLCDTRGTPALRMAHEQGIHDMLRSARKALDATFDAGGVNTSRIARACGELGLPWTLLPRGFVQAGSGPNARLFKSTLTQETPALSVQIARSKSLTAQVLALHGLPVPDQRIVASEAQAVRAANALGYPVVVKPDNLDGGKGVHAGLRTEAQVAKFYREAAALSPAVIVESHVDGEDVRITVDNGAVVKAIARRPGGVLGDGRQTVRQLLDEAAAQRPSARAVNSRSVVTLDDEALEMLAEGGLSAHSVPGAGALVALRRRANLSTGGTARDVLADMHPDNARLAVRAARALRLDIAGIDLIIPDIRVSWMACRAAICEVNAQPQISTEFADSVYRDMLQRLVRDPVRQRTVLLLEADGAAVAETAARMTAGGHRVLAVRADGTWLDGMPHAPPGQDTFRTAARAELDTQATAVIAAFTVEEVLKHGAPWLHVDEVHVRGVKDPKDERLLSCIGLLAPHVPGGAAGILYDNDP
jgi:cyanophycin synthetase